jgi:hypothetical protein
MRWSCDEEREWEVYEVGNGVKVGGQSIDLVTVDETTGLHPRKKGDY